MTLPNSIRNIFVLEENGCETEYRYPTGCTLNATCDYLAQWEYDPVAQDVRFQISSKDIGRWTGIGLSRKGEMVGVKNSIRFLISHF